MFSDVSVLKEQFRPVITETVCHILALVCISWQLELNPTQGKGSPTIPNKHHTLIAALQGQWCVVPFSWEMEGRLLNSTLSQKGKCCRGGTLQTGEDAMLVFKSQPLGGEGRNHKVTFLLWRPLCFAWFWIEPYGCRAHQANRWWTEACRSLTVQGLPVSAIHRPLPLVLVPRKVSLLELSFKRPFGYGGPKFDK